jgi:ribosomal protein S18 acetylase RimI-like enzyme
VFERETERVIVRRATDADRGLLRQAIIELQNYERLHHTTRLPGEQVADAYVDCMRCRAESCGAVLVAESNSIFAGFVAGWIEQNENIGETPDSNRGGYVSDICVMPALRGRRIAPRLLDEIERHLAGFGIASIRWPKISPRAPAMNVLALPRMKSFTRRRSAPGAARTVPRRQA